MILNRCNFLESFISESLNNPYEHRQYNLPERSVRRTFLPWHQGRSEDRRPDRAGFSSNYGSREKASYVYFSATLDAATWGAELAVGDTPERIYIVEPTGPIENDPNLTDKKFPGNPTKSYRTKSPLRVVDEVRNWTGHSPEQLKTMKDHLARLKEQGIEAIED